MSEIFTPVQAERAGEKDRKDKTDVSSARRHQWLTFSHPNPPPTRSLARVHLKRTTTKKKKTQWQYCGNVNSSQLKM